MDNTWLEPGPVAPIAPSRVCRGWPRGLLALALLLPLLGCETMSDSECQVADWSRVGFTDGALGESERRLADYTKDCAKVAIVPNAVDYRKGWDDGIKRFCTAASGWRAGLDGRSDKASVCVGQSGYEEFARNLNAGMQVYRTQQYLNLNNREIDSLQRKLDIAATDEDRRLIRERMHSIDREQYRLRALMGQQQWLAP